MSLDGKQIQKLKGRITRSNSLPSIFCPAINQLRGKQFDKYFIFHMTIQQIFQMTKENGVKVVINLLQKHHLMIQRMTKKKDHREKRLHQTI